MIHALHIFNLVAGRKNDYGDGSVKAGRMICRIGGRCTALMIALVAISLPGAAWAVILWPCTICRSTT